jgi:hypothetical protein
MKRTLLIGSLLAWLLCGSSGCLAGGDYYIAGTWDVSFAITGGGSGNGTAVLTCLGTVESGSVQFVDNLGHSGSGPYTVSGKNVTVQLTGAVPGGSETLSGSFSSEDTISGTFTSAGGVSGTWTAARK